MTQHIPLAEVKSKFSFSKRTSGLPAPAPGPSAAWCSPLEEAGIAQRGLYTVLLPSVPLISHCIFQHKEAQNENVKDGRRLALSTADSQTLP